MADDEVIVIRTEDSDLDRTAAKLKGLGKTSKDAGETGRLGLFALGEAAENAADKLGVPHKVSRQLGSSVERMATSLGTAGIALGVVGLAATAAVMIWKKYREEQERIREEHIKEGQAAVGVLNGLLDQTNYTESLTRAIHDLNVKKREMASEDLERGIEAQTQKIIEMSGELANGGSMMQKIKQILTHPFSDRETFLKDVQRDAETGNRELDKQILILHDLYITQQKNKEGTLKGAGKDNEWENMIAFSQAHMKYEQAALDSSRQYTADQAMLTQARIDDANREADAKRDALYSTVGFMSSSFQAMYQAGGAHARRNFSLFKIAATAEALMNADRAAAAAQAWGNQLGGPPLGYTMGIIAFAAGMARVKAIRAMTLEGGGGGGGGGGGYTPSTAGPGSGATGGGAPTSITININGQNVGTAQLTGDVLRTIYNNNGSVDGFSVSVERSA